MKRITIMLPDDLDARLQFEARRRDCSIGDVVREAIDRELPHLSHAGPLRFFSVGEGSPADVSERADHFVAKAINALGRTA